MPQNYKPSNDRDLEGLIADLEDCSDLGGATGYETIMFDRDKARQLIREFIVRRDAIAQAAKKVP